MGIDKFNHEGYFDPTTYEALKDIHHKEMVANKKATYLPMVYVCSPYAGDVEKNVMNARAYSRFAVNREVIPIAPHLLFTQFMDETTERDLAIFMDIALLSKCKELWVFGTPTAGMQKEIDYAKRKKITIRYFSIDMKEEI